MKWIVRIAQWLTGALFIFSGLIKINDPIGTAIKMEEYFEVFAADYGSFFHVFVPYALPIAVFLCVIELVLGIALLIGYRMRLTAGILLAMIAFFTFLTFYSAYYNKVTDCGCFGDAIKLTPWESFTKDVILLIFIIVIIAGLKHIKSLIPTKMGDYIMLVAVAISTGIAIYAIEHLPFIDFRAYKVGTHIPTAMEASAPMEYEYVMERDGKEERFSSYPSDPAYTYKEMIILNPEAAPKITEYSVWNQEGDYTATTLSGKKLLIVVHSASEAHEEGARAISSLLNSMDDTITPMVLTSSDEASYEAFRHETQLAAPYYFADATVLKTMIRSNPGLILIEDGTVKGKWHYNDVPEAETLKEKLDR